MSDQVLARDTVPPATTRRRLSVKRAAFAGLGLAVLVGGGVAGYHWWTVGRFFESTDDAYVGGNVTPIAPHVAGFVQAIPVADNQYVKAGQTLIRLDPADYIAALGHAQAVLSARKATITDLEARQTLQRSVIAQAQADLAAKLAQAVFAGEEAERYRALATTAAGSRQDAQKALAADKAARAAVVAGQAAIEAAHQQLTVLDAQIAVAKADLAAAEADVNTARLNLGYTTITAPVDGYIGNRSAQVGSYVAAGTNLLSVVPAQGLWVDANFKEDELSRMRPGDKATIVADVLPDRTFHGHVGSLSPATGAVFSVIPPQNATGNFTKIVQRVPVRIILDGDGQALGLLRAGLSTTVGVDTRR
ncbi:MAG TPA: HlyD family secretion protein [Rhodopila sp.]|uniref:HlyD family secretion protein n=1 Tax=Rhodopila sp. TaxID=2480087 RepID=UPI002B81C528|nr:HlyD family secretion protein [Rhodopila sp.]HVY15328.1 HlyD family secretion protein [Rhodopila sp.]